MKTINIKKIIKEIEHKFSNYEGDFHRYYVDGYYDAQKDCLKIIKDNIKDDCEKHKKILYTPKKT
jgi:hypothetical protein